MVPPGCRVILWEMCNYDCMIVMKTLAEHNYFNGFQQMSLGMDSPANNPHMYDINIVLHIILMK